MATPMQTQSVFGKPTKSKTQKKRARLQEKTGDIKQDVVLEPDVSYMQKQKEIYEKAYEKWTPEDEHKLVEMRQSDSTIKALVETLKRNKGAIISRLRKLGIE